MSELRGETSLHSLRKVREESLFQPPGDNESSTQSSSHCKLVITYTGKKPVAFVQCWVCNDSFSQKADFDEHMQTHREIIIRCSICNESFSQRSDLKDHMLGHTGVKSLFIIHCPICNKSFREKRYYEEHMEIHKGGKPFQCSVCNKSYPHIKNLMQHMRLHSAEKPHKCSECGKSFALKSYLQSHMKTHAGKKVFQCSKCYKSYSQKCTLEVHMRNHSGERPFQCSVCGKSFTVKSTLVLHMRTHTEEKPFQCTECCRSFSQQTNLRRHMQTHIGEKQFQCPECSETFSFKEQLRKHFRGHTRKNTLPSADSSVLLQSNTFRKTHLRACSVSRKFKCFECSETFMFKYQLSDHIMSRNTGEKPFPCIECCKSYSDSGSLRQHMTIHKGDTVLFSELSNQELGHTDLTSSTSCQSEAKVSQSSLSEIQTQAVSHDMIDDSELGFISCEEEGVKVEPDDVSDMIDPLQFDADLGSHIKVEVPELKYVQIKEEPE